MKFPETINLGICVPSMGSWRSAFGRSLSLLCADFTMWKPPGVKGKGLALFNVESSMLSKSREELVREALKAGCTHVLFLDSDMVFPKDLARRLLERGKDIIACNCTTRMFPVTPTAHDFDGKVLDSSKLKGVQKVRQVGLAVAMINTEVFKKLQPPMFLMDWIPEMGSYCGEDIFFSQVVQAAGYDFWVDHDLSKVVGHVGDLIYGYPYMSVNDTIQAVCGEGK